MGIQIKDNAFQITICETNLRYLLGEPESQERDRKIQFMRDEIKRLKEEEILSLLGECEVCKEQAEVVMRDVLVDNSGLGYRCGPSPVLHRFCMKHTRETEYITERVP